MMSKSFSAVPDRSNGQNLFLRHGADRDTPMLLLGYNRLEQVLPGPSSWTLSGPDQAYNPDIYPGMSEIFIRIAIRHFGGLSGSSSTSIFW